MTVSCTTMRILIGKYPSIAIPNEFRIILDKKIKHENAFKRPKTPELQEINPFKFKLSGMLFLMTGIMMLVFTIQADEKIQGIFGTVISFICSALVFNYKDENAEITNEILMRKYNKDLKEFEENYKIIELVNQINANKEKLKQYNTKILKSFISNKKLEYTEPNDEITKVGICEKVFARYLSNKFGDENILTGKKVAPYFPDIILKYKSNLGELYFDIEIDEPYDFFTREPIHFNFDKNESNYTNFDEERDNFFSRNNWIVIRFSEKQVIDQTENCINFILEMISEINNLEFRFPRKLVMYNDNGWTYEEAKKMETEKYREKYLNYYE